MARQYPRSMAGVSGTDQLGRTVDHGQARTCRDSSRIRRIAIVRTDWKPKIFLSRTAPAEAYRIGGGLQTLGTPGSSKFLRGHTRSRERPFGIRTSGSMR